MKYLNINYTSIALLLLMVTVVSCDALTGEPDLPIPLDETLNNTGAFLRVDSVDSPGFDVADLSTAEYAFYGSLSSNESGEDVDRVDIYASYRPTDPNASNIDEPSSPIVTVDAASLSIAEDTGLPHGRFAISLQEILSALSIQQSDLELGDVFNVRWELVMDDGTTYSVEDAAPAIGGGFYNSPYNANASVVQSVPENLFVGEYQITQNNASGTFNPIFSGVTFTVTLRVDPSNSLNGRLFDAMYLGGFARTIPLTMFRRQDFQTFTFADNWTSVPLSGFDFGLLCGGDVETLKLANVNDATQSNFDVNDDSQFTFTVIDNPDGACGGAGTQVSFTAVKQ